MEMHLAQLEVLKLTELYKLAKKYQIPYYGQMKKKELIFCHPPCSSGGRRSFVHGRSAGGSS